MKDNLFFAFLDMIIALGELPESLAGWAEGCCCHKDLLAGHRRQARMQNLRAAFHHSAGTCSMKGKRLPELVAGSFNQYFDRVCEVALTELMMGCRVHLSEEQWAIVLQNFEAGKAVLWGGLKVKTDFVKRLP
jgi:hypothetical protein